MTYPSAPWSLQGFGLQTLQMLDIERVRSLIPSELEIVALWPGKTAGGIYVSSYGPGSALEYNELIVVGALVRYAGKLGAWVSHIYVDQPDSVAGGREIWGLPKELAEFRWNLADNPSVEVYQADQLLCKLDCNWHVPGWSQPFSMSAFSTRHTQILMFESQSKVKLNLAGLDLQVPSDSPFGWLNLNQSWLSFYTQQLNLTIHAPTMVGERADVYSYS